MGLDRIVRVTVPPYCLPQREWRVQVSFAGKEGACGGGEGYVTVTDISLLAFSKDYVCGLLKEVGLTRLGSAQNP